MDYKERLVYLKKKLSKMDDQFVIAEDENGIDVAYIADDDYDGFNSVDLYFTGNNCSMTIGGCLICTPTPNSINSRKEMKFNGI